MPETPSLDIWTRIYGGDNHLDVATSLMNVGNVLDDMGKYEEALVQHQKSLDIKIRVFGSEHLDVAASYNNIGHVYYSQGKYEEALDMYSTSRDVLMYSVQTFPCAPKM